MTHTVLLLALALAPPAAAGRRDQAPARPEGFSVVHVLTVLPSGDGGGTVMLADAAQGRVVPIAVGASEALTIALRAERRRYERPLTHDLLDAAVQALGGRFHQVRIDALRSEVFVATLTLRQGDRATDLDLRASDAIAVALGHGLPIWMSDAVLLQTGMPIGEFVPPAEEPAPAVPQL